MPDLQARLQSDVQFRSHLGKYAPTHQATIIVGTYFTEPTIGISKIRNTLTLAGMSTLMASQVTQELEIFEDLFRSVTGSDREKLFMLNKAVAKISLKRAAAIVDEMIKNGRVVTINPEQEDLEGILAVEERVAKVSKSLSARARRVIDGLRRQAQYYDAPIDPSEFAQIKVADRSLYDSIRKTEAAELAGQVAARESARTELKQRSRLSLQAIYERYFSRRSEIKNQPGADSLVLALIKAQIGNEEEFASPVDKDSAYEIASIIYRLLNELERRDKDEVFDQLLSDVDRETELCDQLNMPEANRRLTAVYRWLSDNNAFMRKSEIDIVKKFALEFQTYYLEKRLQRNKGKSLSELVNSETVRAIQSVRERAQFLEIRAFPPGVSNLEALEEDVLDLVTRPGKHIQAVEWERLVALDELGLALSASGLSTQLFRLLPGSLREHFPYYALVIEIGGKRIVVAENPKKDNATYVFEETDPSFASWSEIVQLDKDFVKALGGRAMTHSSKKDLTEHYKRVRDEVLVRLSGDPKK